MSNTKCQPGGCLEGQYCDNGFESCFPCEMCRNEDNVCVNWCKGYIKSIGTTPNTMLLAKENQIQATSNPSEQMFGTKILIPITVAIVFMLLIVTVIILKCRPKIFWQNHNESQSSITGSECQSLNSTNDNQNGTGLQPINTSTDNGPVLYSVRNDHQNDTGLQPIDTYTDNGPVLRSVRNEHESSKNEDMNKTLSISVGTQDSIGAENDLIQSNSGPVSDSHLGAVGGQPQSHAIVHAEEGSIHAMSHLYDNDSGCGSALNNGRRPSEEFEQMNRLLYQERGIDLDRIGQQEYLAQPQDDNRDNDLGIPLEEIFPDMVNPYRQRNRWLYEELKKIDWVMGYHSSGHSIEVYVNLGSLDPRGVEQQLADITGAPITKFHVKQNEDTEFLNYCHKIWMGISFPIRTVPFLSDEVTHYTNKEWNNLENQLKINCVIGGFVSVEGDSGIYCITVSHAMSLGSVCYVEIDDGFHVMGRCISIFNTVGFDKTLCEKNSSLQCTHSEKCECCVDLAVVKILNDNFDISNNVSKNSHDHNNSYDLELFDWQNTSLEEHDCLKNHPIQMKNRLGDIRRGIIENPSCEYSNKEKSIHMHNQIILKSAESEFLSEGDCGCLITSVPNDTSDKVQVYGMFYGILKKQTGEQHAVAFPLSLALAMASKKDFNGKKLSLLKTPIKARASTHEIFNRKTSTKLNKDCLSIDSGIDSLIQEEKMY